jgi:hypothetical protein
MRQLGKQLLWLVVKGVFATLRFCLYVLLLLIGRLLLPLAGLASGAGLMLFLFCALVCPNQVTPMWAGAGLAVGSVVVIIFYHSLLYLVAPDGVVIITEI